MQKFKVKNRQKRKYTKRAKTATPSSLYAPLRIGLMPLLLLAICFLATITISVPKEAYQSMHFSLTLPAFSMQTTFPSFSLPTLSHVGQLTDTIKTVPQTMIQGGTKVLSLRDKFILFIKQLVLNSFMSIKNILLTVGAFIQNFFNQILFLLNLIGEQTVKLVSFIGRGALSILQFFLQTLLFIRSIIMHTILHIITIIGQGIVTISLRIWQAIIRFFSFIGALIIQTGQGIMQWFNGLITTIKQPFIALGKELEKLKPVFSFMQSSFKKSSNGLKQGSNNLIDIPSHAAK